MAARPRISMLRREGAARKHRYDLNEDGLPTEERNSWRRPTFAKATVGNLRQRSSAKVGGGGSRTRVREHVPVGLYMRIRFFFLMPGVRKRLKTVRHQSRFISRPDAETPSD